LNTAIARKRLEEIRDELDRSITVLDRAQQQDERSEEYPQDPADAGANLSETERTAAILAVARLQRGEVLAALRRIEIGTYGTCADCGGGVPQGRLEAKPEAARCVACQSKRDRRRR
jgi:DnaK suppressor protein